MMFAEVVNYKLNKLRNLCHFLS